MSSYPKQYPHGGGVQICAVYGQGGVSDQIQDSLKVGNMQVWSPLEHSWVGVQPNHLALSPQLRKTQSEFPRPPDPGSLVYCLKTTGSGQAGLILGQASDSVNPGSSVAGNINMFMGNPYLQEAFQRLLKMYPMPEWQEKEDRGALIREVKEKSSQYFHGMLQGLPSQASVYELAGQRQPSIEDIETAKEHFTNILGSGLLSQLSGAFMSLGKMSSNLSNKDKKKIKDNMPKELQDGFDSLMYLVPNIEVNGGGVYATDAKVNEDVFMSNAVDLLSQCTTLSDLTSCLSRLQVDKTLYGLEDLSDLEYEIQTAFGNVSHIVTATGRLSVANSNTTNTTTKTKSSFASSMSSSSPGGGSPAAMPGMNMFGDSAGTIFDMMQRRFPDGLQTAKETVEKTNKPTNMVKAGIGTQQSLTIANDMSSFLKWIG